MSLIVTRKFTDWDKVVVRKGTLADRLVKTGVDRKGRQFYNLIAGETVVAVTIGLPPVAEMGVAP